MDAPHSSVDCELANSVARIRLDRPQKLNAFTLSVTDALRAAVAPWKGETT